MGVWHRWGRQLEQGTYKNRQLLFYSERVCALYMWFFHCTVFQYSGHASKTFMCDVFKFWCHNVFLVLCSDGWRMPKHSCSCSVRSCEAKNSCSGTHFSGTLVIDGTFPVETYWTRARLIGPRTELCLNSIGLFGGSWSSMISHCLFCIRNRKTHPTPLVVYAEVVFQFEWRVTYYSSLRAKLVWAPLGMPTLVWSSMNRYRMFPVQTPTSEHVWSTYCTWKVLDGKQPTPDQKSHWVKGQLYCSHDSIGVLKGHLNDSVVSVTHQLYHVGFVIWTV